jgi:S-adenosylmethionine synthetase
MLNIEHIRKKEEKIEMAELKGKGHPDTLCDDLCELSSKALSKYYLKHFNQVLHHNLDKALLVAGSAKPGFKKGKILQPIKIIIAGRATSKVGKHAIPVEQIVKKVCKDYLKRFPLANFQILTEIKPGTASLVGIAKKHIANDTSFGASYYPYSELEKTILEVNNFIKSLQKKYKAIGDDTKIMGLRENKKKSLTIAIAFIGKYIRNMQEYVKLKEKIAKLIQNRFKSEVQINTLDNYKDIGDIYLTVSGLSAEHGDDGNTGRGNRYNSLITPYRPMSIEAVAGKNIFHPGKLYQILAFKIAKDLVKNGAKYAEVRMMTQIGKSLANPKMIDVRIDGNIDAKNIINRNLRDIGKLQKQIIKDP